MNIKALITMLVLGSSSSAALARPATVSSYAGAPIVRDHRDHRAPMPAPQPAQPSCETTPNSGPFVPAPTSGPFVPAPRSGPFVPLWTTLGTESRIVDGEMSFRVSPYLGRFTSLKLQSSSGKSLIYRVNVQFTNGRTQVVELNRYLTAAAPTITIDLAGDASRAIQSVTVIGRNARQSAYSVLAS